MVDVGTGAGFPGLPLRMLEPSIRLTLLDALDKRIQFLETVCRELGLPDVACVHGRAEEFAADHRESFDLVDLPGGGGPAGAVRAVPAAGEARRDVPGHEIRGLRRGAGRRTDTPLRPWAAPVEAVRDYAIPGTEVRHRLIRDQKKSKKTPEKYPRMFAKIKKNPL